MIERSAPDGDGAVEIMFVLADEDKEVSVVGDFNDWDPMADPMLPHMDGTRRATIMVPAQATICFRYLAEGGEWFDDSDADTYDHRGGVVHATAPMPV